MKKLFFLAFLLTLGFAKAQTLDEIVQKHVEAIGGLDNWNKLKTLKLDCVIKQGGTDIILRTYQRDKEASRQEVEVMGMIGYSFFTTKEGWSMMPFQGQTKPEAMTAEDLKNAQDQLWIKDEFITYKEMGKTIELLGKEDIEGMECFKIKMVSKTGIETTFFLDTESYYVIKTVSKFSSNGKEISSETLYSNFEKLPEGIVYPMSINSDWGTMDINKVEFNPVLDDSLFKLPN